MDAYPNSDSGIDGVEFGETWIVVNFKKGGKFEYRSPPIEQHHIERMKALANAKDGLCTYISTHRDEVYSKSKKVP